MPVLQPAEPWRKTGRLEIEELFKLTDRKGSELVLAMTHEEAVTFHVAQIVRSYRDLPLIVYHFQVKERDEPRPRAGVLRTREFVMKDSYSFDRDQAGLEERYAAARRRLRPHHGAHRAALLPGGGRRRDDGRRWARTSTWRRARPARTRSCSAPGYAANVEVARAQPGHRAGRRASTPRTASSSAIEPAIEVGNIFKLGTRYSEPLGARYLDEHGRRAAGLDGLLRDRPGAHRRGGGRAVRRRARHLLADARSRRSPCTSWRSASRARPSATRPSAATRCCATAGWRCSTTTATSARARSSPTPSCSAARCG